MFRAGVQLCVSFGVLPLSNDSELHALLQQGCFILRDRGESQLSQLLHHIRQHLLHRATSLHPPSPPAVE